MWVQMVASLSVLALQQTDDLFVPYNSLYATTPCKCVCKPHLLFPFLHPFSDSYHLFQSAEKQRLQTYTKDLNMLQEMVCLLLLNSLLRKNDAV